MESILCASSRSYYAIGTQSSILIIATSYPLDCIASDTAQELDMIDPELDVQHAEACEPKMRLTDRRMLTRRTSAIDLASFFVI